jgi:GNAT superfamily N-acetyltransferase
MRARPAIDGDRDDILRMLAALAADRPAPWFIGTPEQQLEWHDHAIVLEAAGAVAGCALQQTTPVGVGWVRCVWVEQQHRRRGGARALMAAAEDWLLEAGCHRSKVTVLHGNAAARALYEDLGYHYAGAAVEGGADHLQRLLGPGVDKSG